MDGAIDHLHATAISVGGRAILIRGASGCGKSDLAFRCLAVPVSQLNQAPARLVSDDQVLLRRQGQSLIASAPATLFGKIEVRGLGILDIDPAREANVALVADIAERETIERYPDPWPTTELLGLRVPVLSICAYDASAPLKLLAAMAMIRLPSLKSVD